MNKVIIYKNENDIVSICTPASEWTIEEVLAKDCPAGAIIVDDSTLPKEPQEQWRLQSDGTVIVVPPTPIIPIEVTMRQARLALFQQGLLANVQTAIDGLSEPQKTITQISWDYAQTVKRDDDLVVQLSGALGLDSVALDDLFTLASTL